MQSVNSEYNGPSNTAYNGMLKVMDALQQGLRFVRSVEELEKPSAFPIPYDNNTVIRTGTGLEIRRFGMSTIGNGYRTDLLGSIAYLPERYNNWKSDRAHDRAFTGIDGASYYHAFTRAGKWIEPSFEELAPLRTLTDGDNIDTVRKKLDDIVQERKMQSARTIEPNEAYNTLNLVASYIRFLSDVSVRGAKYTYIQLEKTLKSPEVHGLMEFAR